MESLLLGIQRIFPTVLRMSLAASILVLIVIAVRFLFRRMPKWIVCLLWLLVAVRLVCPILPESRVSLMPRTAAQESQLQSALDTGLPAVEFETVQDHAVNQARAEEHVQVSHTVTPSQYLPFIWVIGLLGMLAYALISFLRLKRRVAVTVQISDGVLACDEVPSPFILGVFRPKIYVPSGLKEPQLSDVLAHEHAHLQRKDHWWKPLGFLLLAVYWFNPLCWLAYILLCRDIEMACDEKVIREMDRERMAAYSQTILDCGLPRKRIAACPLAFGEVGIKARVKSVLNYKKPAFWIILTAILACAVLAVCLLTDPMPHPADPVLDTAAKFYLTVGADGVKSIQITAPYFSGGCENADGSLYQKGEQVWLEVLDGREDLRGVTFTALDEKGNVLWTASVPDTEDNKGFTRLTQDGWSVTILGGTQAESTDRPTDLEALRAKYPEYFDLGTFKGLELYVWQMAPDSYSCGLMLGTNRDKTLEELMNLKGASIEEMRTILSTYDIPQEDVFIIPWQNPISSYLCDYWIRGEQEDDATYAARQQAYILHIRAMLFGEEAGNGNNSTASASEVVVYPETDLPVLIGPEVRIMGVTYIHGGHVDSCTVTGENVDRLRDWANELQYELLEYEEGKSPGDSNGGTIYSFTMTGGDYDGFSYTKKGINGYLLIEGTWYTVTNPSDPPCDDFPWQPALSFQDIPSVPVGTSEIAGFDFTFPADMAGSVEYVFTTSTCITVKYFSEKFDGYVQFAKFLDEDNAYDSIRGDYYDYDHETVAVRGVEVHVLSMVNEDTGVKTKTIAYWRVNEWCYEMNTHFAPSCDFDSILASFVEISLNQ